MRSKILSVSIIVLSVLILVGVVITVLVLLNSGNRDDVLELHLEPGQSETVEFRDLNMYPGKVSEYTLLLYSDIEDEFRLSIDFSELEGEVLKDYIDVTLELNGEFYCKEELSELLAGEAKTVGCYLQEEHPYSVKVSYTMPEDTGNEPQGTKALFDIILTASNE